MIAGSCAPPPGASSCAATTSPALAAHQRCKRGIARTFQLVRPFPDLTVLANVAVGRVYGHDAVWNRRQAEADSRLLLEQVGLGGRGGKRRST